VILPIEDTHSFNIQKNNYDREQGISDDRYKLIPRCLIFIRKSDSFLLLMGASKKRIWANKYNGFGGHIEIGEDIKTAALRELHEETGLSVDLNLRGVVTVDPGGEVGVGIFVFTGEYTSGEVRPSKEGELQWVEIKDMKELPLVEDVQVILERIMSMKDNSPPFSAHSFYDLDGNLVVNFRN
jgi:8-oxo-dGTP diphosphatase